MIISVIILILIFIIVLLIFENIRNVYMVKEILLKEEKIKGIFVRFVFLNLKKVYV